MTAAFPPGSVIRRVNEEPAVLVGAGRALVLQLAHPHVAAGVDEHSDFQHDPFRRLQGTLEAVYAMVYGPASLADGVGRRVRWIHDFVRSPVYEANDPANLLWVHATLLDTALDCYRRMVGPLTDDELESYYGDMTQVAARFGCPVDAQPSDYAGFRAYWERQIATLEVTDVGRRLAGDVLAPQRLPLQLQVPLRPAFAALRLVTIGTTPPRIREQFGWTWDPDRQRRLDRFHGAVRAWGRATPRSVRVGPGHLHGRLLLHRARRHVAAHDARMPTPTG